MDHWVYLAPLRRERELWRTTVLWLASSGLAVSLSGLTAGLHAHVVRRRDKGQHRRKAARDTYLRWHQQLGLMFGALVTTWLLSGVLSLSPFQWTGPGLDADRRARL